MPPVAIPSSARHEKPGVNPRGPPRKAKYYWTTDSVIVARAKGEKYPVEGSEIVPETMYLQAVGGLWPPRGQRLTACLLHNDPASYAVWRG